MMHTARSETPLSPRRRAPIGVQALSRWHLLSLDAPCVAVLWTWFIARADHVRLSAVSLAAMGVAVWMLYAADRLLDARLLLTQGPVPNSEIEPRHRFHHLHRRGFRLGIVIGSLALAALLPQLPPEAIRLYLVLGGLLFGYLIVIHAPSPAQAGGERNTTHHRLPKEIAVGIFFSAAAFIPTVARAPSLRGRLLPGALLLAALCSLNCLFIYAWEHPRTATQKPPATQKPSATHPLTRHALRLLLPLTIGAIAAGFGLTVLGLVHSPQTPPWPIPLACSLAALLLLLLDRSRSHLSETTLRAAADLCLLTPLLFLPWLTPQ